MDKKRDSFFLPRKQKNIKQQDKNLNAYKKETNVGKEENQKTKRMEEFNKNREGLEDKKPFDKKTYRLKKYSNKYKLEQWEEQRKKKLLREYYKETKNDPTTGTYKPVSFDEDITDGQVGKYVRHPDMIKQEDSGKLSNKDPFRQAKQEYNKIKQEKLQKKQEIAKSKEERQKKLQEYKRMKQERFKKLSKKNKKGQPAMTGRLELLLEKIQKGVK